MHVLAASSGAVASRAPEHGSRSWKESPPATRKGSTPAGAGSAAGRSAVTRHTSRYLRAGSSSKATGRKCRRLLGLEVSAACHVRTGAPGTVTSQSATLELSRPHATGTPRLASRISSSTRTRPATLVRSSIPAYHDSRGAGESAGSGAPAAATGGAPPDVPRRRANAGRGALSIPSSTTRPLRKTV